MIGQLRRLFPMDSILIPEETSSRSVAPALPHDEQIARAKQVERYERDGEAATEAVCHAARDANCDPRSIWRAKKYQEAFEALQEDQRDTVRGYVNGKKVSVRYIAQLATLAPEQQRKFFDDCGEGIFPKRGSTIQRPKDNTNAPVTVPEDDMSESYAESAPLRQSYRIQAILAECGEKMGFKIWLPKHDRSAVLQDWQPEPGALIDVLPLIYNEIVLRTIEQIDVLWLKRHNIVRAFEVEHTTAVYSGILRMADLVALMPNLPVKLHIVAPTNRREKVLAEITRPVFSLLEGKPLSEICTYLPYDAVEDRFGCSDLPNAKDGILEKYAEYAEGETD